MIATAGGDSRRPAPVGAPAKIELMQTNADPSELRKFADLAARWEAWAQRAHVKPAPGDNPGAATKAKKKAKQKSDE